MSVQAQQLPSLGGEHRSRATQVASILAEPGGIIDPRAFMVPASFNSSAGAGAGVLMDECQQQQVFLGGSVMDTMQRTIPHGASPMLPFQGFVLPNFSHLYQQSAPVVTGAVECVPSTTPIGSARKKRKESVDRRPLHAQAQAHIQLGVDLNQTLGASVISVPQVGAGPGAGALVSTGLRLAFDDEHSSVTSSRPSSTNASASSLTFGDEFALQFSTHQEDLNQLLKAQAEQLRQALEETTQAQAKAIMASIEGELSRKMREKEVEMERVSRRNADLEERVRQLMMEREVWQSKAKSNEAMVAILRSNLQQAMVQVQHQSREPSRAEGCGDSEVDDAASVYIDDNPPAQQSRALMMRNAMIKSSHHLSRSSSDSPALARACRRCGTHEASVLLLPCLHLCLCLQCNQSNSIDRCPVCSSLVSNTAEVYLS